MSKDQRIVEFRVLSISNRRKCRAVGAGEC